MSDGPKLQGEAPLLVAHGLVVGYQCPLLGSVDLELRPAQAWFVLGQNGSGKTTLVATLLGVVPRLGGTLQQAPGLRSDLGYVPQDQRFDPPLPFTVAEFVEIGLDDAESRRSARAAVAHALAVLRVTELATHQVRTLSHGQRRRVLIARALARQPRLLVLDEPMANLDQRSALTLADDLESLRCQGLCIVHVAHDLAVARDFATHIALVDRGRVATGVAAGMLASAALRMAFGEGCA